MTLFHRRCETLEAALRARISDLESTREQEREAWRERETELFNRLMAVTNPGALAASVAANRSDRPATGLPGVPIRKQVLPGATAFSRERVVGGGSTPILRPSDSAAPAAPASVTSPPPPSVTHFSTTRS